MFAGTVATIKVDTLNGAVKGFIVDSPQGVKVREFLGIPFALPPVGDLRFHDPIPIGNFSEGIVRSLFSFPPLLNFIS